ncbi:lipoate--protein ligase family protein [Arthrobacter frigidicola]|nr:lipoate--protein ligase family protein [Arthrobacter frigidicola]
MGNPWDGADTLEVHQLRRTAGAAEDLDAGIALLREVAAGRRGPTLRLYRPEPTVAFGQRDARLPGFPEATGKVRAAGFEPVVRRAGGRAAAYHRGCLVVDHIEPASDPVAATRARFEFFGGLFARALRDAGVSAAVGEIPGEYCPGEFSVHGPAGGRGQLKLVGTAQRVVAGAWLFSSVLIIEDAAPLRAVLTDAYSALDLKWDPATAGAAEDLRPGLRVRDLEETVLGAYDRHVRLVPAPQP